VRDDQEIPLVAVEITEAAKAEDHELQKSYGAVAALLAQCFYLKISGAKLSSAEFGGAPYNPYSSPRAFIERLDFKGFIFAEWPTEEDNPYQLKHPPNFLACPPEIPIVTATVTSAISAFMVKLENWFEQAVAILERSEAYPPHFEKVRQAPAFEETLAEWQAREERNTRLDRLRYLVRADWIGAKINRLSHAMDPDRGILMFISALCSQTHDVFGIYALTRQRSGAELKGSIKNLTTLRRRFNAALQKDEQVLADWLSRAIKRGIAEASHLSDEINIQQAFEQHRDQIESNRLTLMLAYFLDGLYLNHNGVKVTWDRYKLLGVKRGEFLQGLRRRLGFNVPSIPLELEEVTREVNEDEVTYAIVHRVLIPNQFRVISISYPGAQGGTAILPELGKGKSQSRKYLDVIALPPEAFKSFDVLLNENKGKFSKSTVEADIAKLKKYLTEPAYTEALTRSLIEANVIDRNGVIQKILIGVGFAVDEQTHTDWRPLEVDFIFRIESRYKWSIGLFRQELRDLIPMIEGATRFPPCYQIKRATNTMGQ
jgi:hypothetical protein